MVHWTGIVHYRSLQKGFFFDSINQLKGIKQIYLRFTSVLEGRRGLSMWLRSLVCIIRELDVKAHDAFISLWFFFQLDGKGIIDQSGHDYPICGISSTAIYIFLPLNAEKLSLVEDFQIAQIVIMDNINHQLHNLVAISYKQVLKLG